MKLPFTKRTKTFSAQDASNLHAALTRTGIDPDRTAHIRLEEFAAISQPLGIRLQELQDAGVTAIGADPKTGALVDIDMQRLGAIGRGEVAIPEKVRGRG